LVPPPPPPPPVLPSAYESLVPTAMDFDLPPWTEQTRVLQ